MTKKLSQGAAANRNGKIIESAVETVCEAHEFPIFRYVRVRDKPTLVDGLDKYVLKNVPYNSIYEGAICWTEFVIVYQDRRIRVECKWQKDGGSADEKFPYMWLNAVNQYPEREIIFLVEGAGFRDVARAWLQRQIDENDGDYKSQGKEIRLMNLVEFITWFGDEFD